MDPVWLLVALIFGLTAQQLKLPALVGFLLAGFALNLLGQEGGEILSLAANFGVLLLLFTIGLKLRLQDFLAPEIYAVGTIHMGLIVFLVAGLFLMLGLGSFALFADLNWKAASMVGFAFSFSSTVYAVKILEERGETRARHALIAIGILIIQDLLAVGFLLVAEQKLPSIWAIALLALPLLRPFLLGLMQRAGHGEVLVLFGLAMTALGAEACEFVGLKGGLGALMFGVLLSGHSKTVELAKSLLGFKDFFLLGFFLSIGLMGLPSLLDIAIVTVLVAVLMPIKMVLYFWLMTRIHVPARTAFLAMLGLATFSEFGLIVAVEGARLGMLSDEWLVLTAIAVAISFAAASLMNARVHDLYQYLERFLVRFESKRLPADLPASIGDAEVLIVGMGRLGMGAYRSMQDNYAARVCGIEVDRAKKKILIEKGFNAISGDAEDIEFWRQMDCSNLRLILLTLPKHDDMMTAIKLLNSIGFSGKIGAVSRYEDERQELLEAGVDAAYNYYTEAGTGFADHVQRELMRGKGSDVAASPSAIY